MVADPIEAAIQVKVVVDQVQNTMNVVPVTDEFPNPIPVPEINCVAALTQYMNNLSQ